MSQIDAPAEKAQPAVSRSRTDTRLHGYRLVIVRLLCLSLSIVSVGLVLASIPSYFASLHLLCTGTAAPCSTSGQLAPADLQRLQALGLSIDFFATSTIADRVDEVLDHRDRMQALRDGARETAVQNFDLKTRQLPAWAGLIEDIIAGRRPALDLN